VYVAAVVRRAWIPFIVAAGCAAPTAPSPPTAITVIDGYDWALPPGVGPRPATGFYGDQLAPEHGIDVRVVDLTWRQLEPTEGALRHDTYGHAQDQDFPSWADQRAEGGRYWLRLWLTGVDWAPAWLPAACGVAPIGVDGDGQAHLPLWQPCVWAKARALWQRVLAEVGADPALVMVYVPGGFTWNDFDFPLIDGAVAAGLAPATLAGWFDAMVADLAAAAGPAVGKLVYTGEDYPSARLGAVDDLLAQRATAAGLGIRAARGELANHKLAAAPAWGARIAADGHVVVDPAAGARGVRAVELECYDACGTTVADPDELAYAVRTSTWKALTLGAQWLFVAPVDSHLVELADHWRWVRAELGRTAADAFDGWVALRDAEDTAWADDATVAWPARPWVANLERLVVQREVAPDGRSARGTEVRAGVLERATAPPTRAAARPPRPAARRCTSRSTPASSPGRAPSPSTSPSSTTATPGAWPTSARPAPPSRPRSGVAAAPRSRPRASTCPTPASCAAWPAPPTSPWSAPAPPTSRS
jgi:hypothetical protein